AARRGAPVRAGAERSRRPAGLVRAERSPPDDPAERAAVRVRRAGAGAMRPALRPARASLAPARDAPGRPGDDDREAGPGEVGDPPRGRPRLVTEWPRGTA